MSSEESFLSGWYRSGPAASARLLGGGRFLFARHVPQDRAWVGEIRRRTRVVARADPARTERLAQERAEALLEEHEEAPA